MLRLAIAAVLLAGCEAGPAPGPRVESWGTMFEALREGRDEGRVRLVDHATPGSIGVGALAGLAGEVTIHDGEPLVATGPEARHARPDEQATLLLQANVSAWTKTPVPDCPSYEALEKTVRHLLVERGFDPEAPLPVRIRGRARDIEFHVIRGACPIANPRGPAPWRAMRSEVDVLLVGFFVQGAAGRWTHHNRQSHLHAIVDKSTGHLDAVSLTNVTVELPATR